MEPKRQREKGWGRFVEERGRKSSQGETRRGCTRGRKRPRGGAARPTGQAEHAVRGVSRRPGRRARARRTGARAQGRQRARGFGHGLGKVYSGGTGASRARGRWNGSSGRSMGEGAKSNGGWGEVNGAATAQRCLGAPLTSPSPLSPPCRSFSPFPSSPPYLVRLSCCTNSLMLTLRPLCASMTLAMRSLENMALSSSGETRSPELVGASLSLASCDLMCCSHTESEFLSFTAVQNERKEHGGGGVSGMRGQKEAQRGEGEGGVRGRKRAAGAGEVVFGAGTRSGRETSSPRGEPPSLVIPASHPARTVVVKLALEVVVAAARRRREEEEAGRER